MEYSLPIVLYGNILIPRLHHLFVKVEAEVEHLPFLNGGEGCADARFLFFFMGFVNSYRSRPGSNMDPPLTFVSPHPVQQNSYELQLETRSWLDAQSFCRLNHADLANVTSPAEGEKVKALLQRDGVEQAWFGLHRDSWVWTDGSATSYTSWLAGQPNNAGRSQGCVYMEKENWNDFPCTNQYYVLCQSKATFTPPSATRV
uniref:C-type lectin domain-containing protein n=1 Tax=Oryzias latipes TaxID=8090 RepID=A0A3P9MLF5_ORYLA